MLICPQCKSENPNHNKFCQTCGTSLMEIVCNNCYAKVALDQQKCQECGKECGRVFWAIITQRRINDKLDTVVNTSDQKQQNNEYNEYLDSQNRYKVLYPLCFDQQEIKVKVLDCQPYQLSPLEVISKHKSCQIISKIPDVARIYLDLSAHGYQGMPHLHDAWQDDSSDVLILGDRSCDPLLLDVWQKEETSIFQILHWFSEMIQLWQLLEQKNCCQSLLSLSNLRLDEDQKLTLERLYLEDRDKSQQDVGIGVNIKSLGRLWRNLFRESQRTQFGLIVQMLEDIENGKMEEWSELRSRLESILASISTSEEQVFTEIQSAPTVLDNQQVEDMEENEDMINKQEDALMMVLPMQLSSLEYSGCTDVGKQRDHNEDYFAIDSKIHEIELPNNHQIKARGLYIICDGMGGHAGGEVASELAVKTIRGFFEECWQDGTLPSAETIKEAVYLANQAIYDFNQDQSRSGIARMGTTLVMLLLQDNQAAIAHVGDSRLYSITSERGLEQLTIDHEVGQREIAKGVEPSIAYGRPDAYQLTQALGPRHQNYIYPDIDFVDITESMLFLLASDGLSDNDFVEIIWEEHLQRLLDSGTSLAKGVQNLIELANEHNGHDNITAILVRVKVRPNTQSLM
ncbi:serine/threonine phosphatase [Anabaena sp. FACHB-1237]|uniref:serine/threonine phosphatase n=1 Tax=Anabaena sp. FACHB-1237 TaxID=2692769 RepID=UPI00167FFD2D|nr:serine/threonine phosphatase [Anabaena sp. FACHB-1237]MBD2138221.1 serine/threonine phosphatase [Anabaena sp. FACHB-1237]